MGLWVGSLSLSLKSTNRETNYGGGRHRKIKIEWRQGGSVKRDGWRMMKDGEGETEMKKIIGYKGKHNNIKNNYILLCNFPYLRKINSPRGRS